MISTTRNPVIEFRDRRLRGLNALQAAALPSRRSFEGTVFAVFSAPSRPATRT